MPNSTRPGAGLSYIYGYNDPGPGGCEKYFQRHTYRQVANTRHVRKTNGLCHLRSSGRNNGSRLRTAFADLGRGCTKNIWRKGWKSRVEGTDRIFLSTLESVTASSSAPRGFALRQISLDASDALFANVVQLAIREKKKLYFLNY